MSSVAPQVPDLEFLDELGRGARNLVFRGRRRGRLVAVKVPRVREPGAAAEYRREASLQARVQGGGLPEVYEVGCHEDWPFLVSELVEGENLAAALQRGPLAVAETLRLAGDLARTLAAIHDHGLVHRDLKPANILLTPARARLVDFGLATRSHLSDRSSAIGTFRYSAPEQTGMLHRPLDGRADLYALGVVLFECLAGRPPFDSQDPAELIRQHGVQAVPDLRRLAPEAPEWLTKLVLRLLAKDPDDRPRCARSLLQELGEPALPVAGPTLVGREKVLASMLRHWNEALSSGGRLLLIRGEGGSGKTVLAQELARRCPEALVLRGRCEPTPVPFGMLRDLVPAELTESVIETVRQAAGGQAALLGQVLPELSAWLAPGRADSTHWLQAVSQFLLTLAGQRPVLVLLDDLQWIDPSSLQVLRRVLERLPETRCLIVATSREDFSPATECFALEPLNAGEIEELLRQTLGGSVEPRLVSQVLLASNGNPFAASEAVLAALDGGFFVPHWGAWRCHGEELDLSGDVLSVIQHRLEPLSATQRRTLQAAAVLGRGFPAAALEAEELYAVLAEGTRLHLIEQVGSGEFRFVHDRVREALLRSLSAEERRELHLQAAERVREDVFARAEHLWQGSPDEAETLRANAAAGRLALERYAYEEAYEFFQRARGHLSPADHEAHGEACFRTTRCAEALAHLQVALAGAATPEHRAELYYRIAMVHMVELDTGPAWAALVSGLRELGLKLCAGHASRLTFLLRSRLTRPSRADLAAVPLYLVALQICLFDARIPELVELLARGLWAAPQLGPSPALASLYSFVGLFWASAGSPAKALKYAQKSEQVGRELADPAVLAQSELYAAVAVRILGREPESAERLAACLSRQGSWLSTYEYLIGILDLTHNLHFRGWVDQARHWAEVGARRVKTEHFPMVVTVNLGPLHAAMGRYAESQRQIESLRQLFQASPARVRRAGLLVAATHAALESGELGAETERLIADFHQLRCLPRATPVPIRSFYILEPHIRYRQCLAAPERLPELARALGRLKGLTGSPLFATHYQVLLGAYERLRGHRGRARRALEEAERLSQEHDNLWVRLEVARQKALLLQGPARLREGAVAHWLAREAGWVSQVHQLAREYPLEVRPPSASRGDSALTVRLQRSLDALLQVSLASTQVLDSDKLCHLALRELVRILGAERAFLFLCDPELRFETGLDCHGAVLPEPRDYASTAVQQVSRTRQTLLLSSSEEGRLLGSESVVAHDLRSLLAAPLMLRERLLGVVYLDSRLARGVFSQDDVQLLHALASQIAVTLETARSALLEVEVRAEREQRLLAEQLRELVASLLAHLETEQILQKLLAGLEGVVGYASAVALWEGQEPVVRGQPELARARSAMNASRPLEGQGWLAVPLRSFDGGAGLVALERAESFSAAEVELTQSFAGYASLALENARLFSHVQRLATTDELTGLSNRRHFFAQAEDEFRRADRLGHELSVLMFDVDHFKKFNDKYGHATGDQVLSTTAARCRRALRGIDVLGRYGGEEFAVVLVGTGRESGLATAERLRRAMADCPFETAQGDLAVTISLGLATRKPGEALELALERADQALYAAKAAGRNRVEAAE